MVIRRLPYRLRRGIQPAIRVSLIWKVCIKQTRRVLHSYLLFIGDGIKYYYHYSIRMVEQIVYSVFAGTLYLIVGSQIDTKPDSWFWYGLSILLAGTLIGIIWRFANKVSNTLDEVRKIVWMHEHDIKQIKTDIVQLKGRKR